MGWRIHVLIAIELASKWRKSPIVAAGSGEIRTPRNWDARFGGCPIPFRSAVTRAIPGTHRRYARQTASAFHLFERACTRPMQQASVLTAREYLWSRQSMTLRGTYAKAT